MATGPVLVFVLPFHSRGLSDLSKKEENENLQRYDIFSELLILPAKFNTVVCNRLIISSLMSNTSNMYEHAL